MAMCRQLTGSPSRYGSPATRVWPCSIEPLVVRGRAGPFRRIPGRLRGVRHRASRVSAGMARLAPSGPLPPGDSCPMFGPCGRMSRIAGASNRTHEPARPERPAVGKGEVQGSAGGNQGEILACAEALTGTGTPCRAEPNSARSGCHGVSAVPTGPSLRSSASDHDERSVGPPRASTPATTPHQGGDRQRPWCGSRHEDRQGDAPNGRHEGQRGSHHGATRRRRWPCLRGAGWSG